MGGKRNRCCSCPHHPPSSEEVCRHHSAESKDACSSNQQVVHDCEIRLHRRVDACSADVFSSLWRISLSHSWCDTSLTSHSCHFLMPTSALYFVDSGGASSRSLSWILQVHQHFLSRSMCLIVLATSAMSRSTLVSLQQRH